MRAEKWITGSLFVVISQLMAVQTLAVYPGTFYHVMMILNRDRKLPRTAPAPNQLWAILDPPAALGSLSDLDLRTNRITRSAENFRDEELLRQAIDDVDPPTEAPAEVEEPITEETEPEVEEPVEEQTEPPVTTPAPIVCGGDLDIGIDPNNLTIPDGRVFYDIIETPGWDDGEYPEDFECEWNLNVKKDCMMGMTLFTVKEGYIRETPSCTDDYLKVIYSGGSESRYCGAVVSGQYSVSGTDLWTLESEVPRTIQLIFKSGIRTGADHTGGFPRGVQIEVTSYCWAFTEDLLSRTTTTAAPSAEGEESETNIEEEGEEEPVTEIAQDPLPPGNPEPPQTPETQGTSETQDIPDAPVAPDTPETQDIPDTPVAPDTPETQNIPDAPAAPDTPETQDIPDAPVAPDTPETSGDESASVVPSNDPKVIADDLPPDSKVKEESGREDQETPASVLGGDAVVAGDDLGALIPSDILPGVPGAPIAPQGASSGGYIPIVPLRESRSHWYPLLEANNVGLSAQLRRK